MSTDSTFPRPEDTEPTQVLGTGDAEPTQVLEPEAEPTQVFEAAPAPAAPVPAPPVPEASAGPGRSTRVRVGTIVWGVVVMVVGSGFLAWSRGLRFDVQLASIGVLAVAGAALVASALTRDRRKA